MQNLVLTQSVELRNSLKRVCFIADTHLTSDDFESNSLFPKRMMKLSKEDAMKLYGEIRNEVHFAYSQTMEQIKSNQWHMIIHLGDVTGGYKERGYHHESVAVLAQNCMNELKEISENVRVCVGNHDIGYESGLAHVTIENFRTCQKIFGDLYWVEDAGDFAIIGLCSSLASYEGDDAEILELKNRQKKFLAENLDKNKKIAICIHDVFSLKHLAREIMPYLSKIERIIFGDLHHPSSHVFARRTFRIFNPVPSFENLVMIACLKKSVCCPSSAPLWWNGGGYMDGLFDGKIKTEPKILQRKTQVPTSSFLTCYYWGKMH